MKYGLSDTQFDELIQILAAYPEIEAAVLFGSRALGTYKEASDVDIALKGEKVTAALASKLKYHLEEESYQPFFYDFVAYPTITNEALRGHIDGKGVAFYRRGWREVMLGDFAEIQTGPFGSLLHAADYVEDGIPSIMPTNIGNRLEIRTDAIACIKKADAQRLERYLVKENDIVYSRRGDVEKCAFITSKQSGWLCGTGCLRVRLNTTEVAPRFCAFYLSTDEIKGWVSGNAVGTTMPNLNSSILARLPLNLPPLPEQKAIASVLSSLDDKIELLHRQNKTLEAMAETLFRQWFVEEAREEWKEGVLGDIAEFNPNYKLTKGDTATYLEMSNVSNSTFNPQTWARREFTSGMKFQNGDTLMARITPCLENGKTCYVSFLAEGEIGWGSTEYIVIRMKKPFHPFISYIIANDKDFRDFAISSMSGLSGRQRAQVEVIKEYDLKISPETIINELNSQLSGIVPKLVMNSNQILILEKLRDTLLPKLMSGEVRVVV